MRYLLLFPLVLLSLWSRAQLLTFESTTLLPGEGLNDVQGMATDDDGNLYLAGRYFGTFNYAGAGEPPLTTDTDQGISQPYLLKRRPDGSTAWVRVLEGRLDGECSGRCQGQFQRVTVAPDGSVYVAGTLETTFDLDTGPGERIDSAVTVLLRFTADGDQLSTYTMTGRDYNSGDERIQALTTDADGNLYLSAIFSREMTFSTGTGEPVSYDQENGEAGIFNGLLMRISPGGTIDWTTLLRLNLLSMPADNIAVINDETLHLITRTRNNVDFDPGPGEARSEGGGQAPTALVRYTLDGDFVSLRSLPGQSGFGGTGPGSWDEAGNVYSTGFVSGDQVNLSPTDAEPVFVPGPSNYIASHDAAGNLRWARTMNANGEIHLSTDRAGNLTITGYIGDEGGNLSVGDGSLDISPPADAATAFVQQFTPDGIGQPPTLAFAERPDRSNGFIVPRALTNGPRGEVYVGGIFRGDLTFPGGVTTDEAGGTQVFLLAFSGLVSGLAGFTEFAVPPRLFPNPTGGELTLRLDREYANGRFELFSADGRRVLHRDLSFTAGVRLSVADLPSGYYVARIVAGGQGAVRPLVVR